MIKKADAITHAKEHGATQEEIDEQAARYVKQVGSVPFRNMIRALNMMTWCNGREEWTRLAAALTARQMARKKA